MPVYNSAPYLKEAIDSILNQTYKNFDFVIINDGSFDETKSIILSYSENRIKYFENSKNEGLIYSLNKGLMLIKSEFVVRMDSDDIAHPRRIEILLNIMENYPELVLLGSTKQYVGDFFCEINDLDISLISTEEINSIAIFNNPFIHPSVILKNSFVKENNLQYDYNFPHSEDNALWLDLLVLGKSAIVDVPLIQYRMHQNQVSMLYESIQKENSLKKRRLFLERLLERDITNEELKILKALSFKENIYDLEVFTGLKNFNSNIIKILPKNKILSIDMFLINKIFYKRVTLLYLTNSHLGLNLFCSYLKDFLFDFEIKIGIKLLVKTLFYEFKRI